MEIVLNPAFVWDCEECGRENFERGIVVEDDEEIRKECGIEPWEKGNFTLAPAEVSCQYCNCSFETLHYQEDMDLEEPCGD